MRYKELIKEMSGVMTKGERDVMLNAGSGKFGNALYFTDQSIVLPDPSVGVFGNAEEKQQALNKVTPLKITWINPQDAASAGAIVVRKFVNEKQQPVYLGKYLSKSSNIYKSGHDATDSKSDRWDVNSLEKLGYVNKHKNRLARLGVEHLATAYNQSMASGDWSIYNQALQNKQTTTTIQTSESQALAPSAVLSNLDKATAQSILAEVTAKYSRTNPDLVEVTRTIASGLAGPWTTPTSVGTAAFYKDFCEILQPLAVITGAVTIKGKVSPANGVITFNSSKSAQFIDSTIHVGKDSILISSKEGAGTTSSVGGLKKHFEVWLGEATPQQKKTYAKEIQALKLIIDSPIQPRNGQIGVLGVPVLYGIISTEEAVAISKMDRTPPGDLKRLGKPNPIPGGISDKLKNIILNSPQSPKHGPSPYYQALNWCMKTAGQKVNADPKMNALLRQIFDSINYVLISTLSNKGTFSFEQRQENIQLTLGESYSPYEAKKRLAFKVF